MRGVEELAERAGVPGFQRRHGCVHAFVLRHTCRTRRSSGSGRPAQPVGVAQRLDAEQLGGPPALRAALVVAGLGEAPRAARVEHGEHVVAEVERDRPRLERRACRGAPPGPPRRGSRRAGRAARSPRRCTRSRSAGRGARARWVLAAPLRRPRTARAPGRCRGRPTTTGRPPEGGRSPPSSCSPGGSRRRRAARPRRRGGRGRRPGARARRSRRRRAIPLSR